MITGESALRLRALRAYETGRLLLGMRRGALALPMLALSLAACERRTAACLFGAALVLTVTSLVWRGGDLGRGARLGLLAGLPPLLLPVLVHATGLVCGPHFCPSFPAVCLFGGAIGGVLLGSGTLGGRISAPGVGAAAATSVLAGSLGCLVAGLGGVLGLCVGLSLGAAPLIVRRA